MDPVGEGGGLPVTLACIRASTRGEAGALNGPRSAQPCQEAPVRSEHVFHVEQLSLPDAVCSESRLPYIPAHLQPPSQPSIRTGWPG